MQKKSKAIFFSLSLICTSAMSLCFVVKAEETKPDSQPNAAKSSSNASSSQILYGRIEQIAGNAGAQFPVLKAESAKIDTREAPKTTQRGQANTISGSTEFSGNVVRSFPQGFGGAWGGHLKIWTSQMDSICWQLDPDEANRTRQLMTPGREGSVNFDFAQNNSGKIELEPAQVIFMVPMKETRMQEQLNGVLGNGAMGGSNSLTLPGVDSGQMANMMKQFTSNMTVPIMVSFGNINRSDVEGVSGNSIRATVLSNTIRQLSPGVLEQQIVTQETQRNNKTGKVRQEFSETVVRFTSQSNNALYVQAAAVNYTSNRQFERKLILYGTIRRGQMMQESNNPMGGLGGMNNIVPGNSGLPSGQNPLQGLFPH